MFGKASIGQVMYLPRYLTVKEGNASDWTI